MLYHRRVSSRALKAIGVTGLVTGLALSPPSFSATTLWWDTAYQQRYEIDVTTGANAPDKGYDGYTARIAVLDTATLIGAGEMQADCSDLRVTFYDGLSWQELPRHVINCNSATTDVRFMLAADIPAGGNDDNYYLYFDNAAPGALPAMSETNVYLWFDDAMSDRSGSYTRGRIDNWHGNGWDDSLAWNAGGYYTYDNGNNFTSGYRRAIDERDVFAEAEFYHTGCYDQNITTGILVRGIIQSGSGGGESSNHYYASNRAEYPAAGCATGGYNQDGDIMIGNRATTAVDGANPGDVVPNTWRRQAVATWLVNPTNASFWDEDNSASWNALGFPGAGNLHVGGSDANDDEGRGFAAIMTAQDQGRVRNILFRRYIAPEPVPVLTLESQPPAILLQKNLVTVYDPVNNTTNPKAIPGSWVDYTITTSNMSAANVDSDTLFVTDPLPANVALFVGDLGGAGSGPVEFTDGGGAGSSGLSYTFGGLGSAGDDVEFSMDGVNYNYTPVPDANGFDVAVRYIRINPKGVFQGGSAGTPTTFDLRIRVRVQ
jgi:uncharacterized repeat protein (TIGR01451 family)